MNQLSSYLCRLGVLEAEFESQYFRLTSNLRQASNSNADAVMNSKATNEYMVYRKIKNFRVDLYEKIQSLKKMVTEEPSKPRYDRGDNYEK